MTDPACQVLWGTDHLVRTDERVDLDLFFPESFASLPGLWPVHTTLPAPFPNPVVFMASFGRVTYMHYPRNGQGWPVLSRHTDSVCFADNPELHRIASSTPGTRSAPTRIRSD